MKYAFTIQIGDWSGDGHGKCESFTINSNKPIEEVREAFFKAVETLPESLDPQKFMCEYEDYSLPEKTYRDALKRGYDFFEDYDMGEGEDSQILEQLLENPDFGPENMRDYVMWFIRQGDPELTLLAEESLPTLAFYGRDEEMRHIDFIGYGLLGA